LTPLEHLQTAIEGGMTIADCIQELAKKNSKRENRLIEYARGLGSDGELEIDEPSICSIGGDEDGGYVLAWFWVDDDEILTCEHCENSFAPEDIHNETDSAWQCPDCAEFNEKE
jgi:hypothetical protein